MGPVPSFNCAPMLERSTTRGMRLAAMALAAERPAGEAAANYGLMDVTAALKWVRPKEMRDYPMPAADLPLIPMLRDLLSGN